MADRTSYRTGDGTLEVTVTPDGGVSWMGITAPDGVKLKGGVLTLTFKKPDAEWPWPREAVLTIPPEGPSVIEYKPRR